MSTLEQLINSKSLDSINRMLTDAMAHQSIQSLIKGEGLSHLVERVVELSRDQVPLDQLKTAALLARLAAVTRNRADEVFAVIPDVIDSHHANIDELADGDEKLYAARALAYVQEDWVAEFCIAQAVVIESADAARQQLLKVAFEQLDDAGSWLAGIASKVPAKADFPSISSYLRRMRRILLSILEVLREVDVISGGEIIENANRLAYRVFIKDCKNAEEDVLFGALDVHLSILIRILEARLSLVLESSSYQSLATLKRVLGPGLWARYLRTSTSINRMRPILCEASLLLAKQNRTDRDILSALLAAFVSKPQLRSHLSTHFETARDVEANVANWWISGGEAKSASAKTKQPMGNNEDRQIGELLLQIEGHQPTMQALPDTVVPILRMHDEVAAATVKRAASAFIEMGQIIRRLARMRRLSRTDLKEAVIEYNPREHEMLGGHQTGVRMVRVVRDGVRKNFGGTERLLAKPQVEPYK